MSAAEAARMDVPRPDLRRARQRRRILVGGAVAVVFALATAAVYRLEPAAPVADRSSIWIGTVERGEMLRQVRGPGVLVPETEQWISASHPGRVERILVRPGSSVTEDTLLLELSNPELAQQALEAEAELRAAEADYRMLEAQLDSDLLDQQAALAAATGDHAGAALEEEANQRLADERLIPDLTLRLSRLRTEQLAEREAIELRRLDKLKASTEAQLAAQRSRLESQRALYHLRTQQLRGLEVVAGVPGVLQEVAVEPGQRVTPGDVLARVANLEELKAEIRIPETQARDVQVGLGAVVDTRNGVVDGEVSRVDPAARQGTVTVDVVLRGPLPRGARPELSVDGTITLERLDDVLYVHRPVSGQPEGPASLFVLTEDGEHARRTAVELGRASTNTVEVVSGLEEGDQVILSDTSAWDGHERIRLE